MPIPVIDKTSTNDNQRPFDSAEIARLIIAGETVKIGDHLVIRRFDPNVVHHCELCDATLRKPYATLSFWADEAQQFIMRHCHRRQESS